MRTAIGVDAGGTKVLGLVVDGSGSILGRCARAMPSHDAAASVASVLDVVLALRDEHPDVMAVGVGAAGMVGRDGVMRFAPNVAWRDEPLRDRVATAVDLPVVVDNDANAAAWAEYRFGAGRGVQDMLMVTVGTGIGGAIVMDGRLARGTNGFAGEIGHIVVEPDGPLCGCGNVGCWEQVASGRAIDRMGRDAAREHPESALARLAGDDPDAVTGTLVTAAAEAGDPMATQVLARVGRRLGEGIAGLVNVLDPEIVVAGGGATGAGDLLLEPTRAAFEATVEAGAYRPHVPIVRALLGADSGAVGAATLALDGSGSR